MRKLKVAFHFTVLFLPIISIAHASGEKGNGGDFIRQTFMDRGRFVISHLKTEIAGKALVTAAGLSIPKLESVLSIQVISVTDQELRDNLGSIVDAIGVKNSIKLNYESWHKKIFQGQPIDQMVFHEMLRAVGVNDDDYRISKKIPKSVAGTPYLGLPPVYRKLREFFSKGEAVNVADLSKPDPTDPRSVNADLAQDLDCTYASEAGLIRYFTTDLQNWQFGIARLRSDTSLNHGCMLPGRMDWYSDFEGVPGAGLFTGSLCHEYYVLFGRKLVLNPETGKRAMILEYIGHNGAPSIQSSSLKAIGYAYCEK